jgi:DNA-binding NtrC family response regulator
LPTDPPPDNELPSSEEIDAAGTPPENAPAVTGLVDHPIEEELKQSYLTYAMSVIVSRALPDVRDGLKPSQRRILVAMNDLNLGPGAGRIKCAKISGDTSGNYHPHGESVIYPTLVRMAQEWNLRHVLIDKQGNFGSIAGLPPAAMRYTEARLSPVAALLLDDLKLDTVDYVPTYDERNMEPTVLPSKFPNLLVNGATGIAVGMATSVPPHNLREICDALVRVIDEPDVAIDELLEIVQGPDFPTGGIICGRAGIRQGYHTGRGTILVRARATIETKPNGRSQIVVTEVPFQQYRDRIVERIGELVNGDKVKGISAIQDLSDLKEPVRIAIDIKRDADPDVVLNQLYQFSPLQDTISIILLALVDGKPRLCNLKDMLQEFIRHRVAVIRRRTQFQLAKARKRKHTIEGLLLALANIDEIIRIIRHSQTQAEAKVGIMGVQCPAAMMARALGDEGFQMFQQERGAADSYSLTAVQADAILRMTLGQLVNLEQERLGGEHRNLLEEIAEYLRESSPDLPVLLITAFADLRQAVAAMKGGAVDYLAKPVDLDELRAAIADALGTAAIAPQGSEPPTPPLPADFISQSPAMRRLLTTLTVVAPSKAPVLITGESGTGKDVVARLIHAWSPQHAGPMIAANCASLPESLIESELFGHTKGAFTGASETRQGFFRAAHGGTLFLDEIAELPLHLQPKLLRALESGQITPVGSDRPIKVDTRLIAATNRNLEQEVAEGRFRDDLYYRINVVELAVAPLRERREDILPLARRFAVEFAGGPVRLSPQAMNCLLAYPWPGNVRELRNAIQRACLLCRGDVILPEHLPPKLAALASASHEEDASRGRLSQVERATIVATVEECGGNRTQAAKKLGISRRALIYKLQAIENESPPPQSPAVPGSEGERA